MAQKTIIILLIGMIFWSLMSGHSTVICYGADGHIAVEPAVHNHCSGLETDTISLEQGELYVSESHGHCTDSAAISNILGPIRKNGDFAQDISVLSSCIHTAITTHTPSIFREYAISDLHFSSFHTPLQTIVLLA